MRLRGRFRESYDLYRRYVRLSDEEIARADGLCGAAMAMRGMCDYVASLELIDVAAGIYEENGDEEGLAFALYSRGGAKRFLARFREARVDLTKSLALAPDRSARAFTLMALGGLDRMTGKNERSLEAYREALAISKRIGAAYPTAYANCGVGNAYRMMRKDRDARRFLSEAEAGYRRIRDIVSRPYTIIGLSLMEIEAGRPGRVDEARRMFHKTDDRRGIVYAEIVEALAVMRTGRALARARILLKRAERSATRLGIRLESAHARYLALRIDGRSDGSGYRRLGVKPPDRETAIP